MKILFVLGSPNPFPGAGWTRIGFFAEDWSKKGHAVEVLGAFNHKTFRQRVFRKSGEVKTSSFIFDMSKLKHSESKSCQK